MLAAGLSTPDYVQDDRDIDQVLALNLAEYGPASPRPSTDVVSTREDFGWRRDQNPAGKAIIPVIRNTRGDVVGFIWLVPLRIRVKKQNYLAATGANMVIEPENRRSFGLVKLVRRFNRALENSDIALHYSFVSEESYKRFRVEDPQRAFTVPLLIKPLDFAGLSRSYFDRKWQRFIGKAACLLSPYFFKRPFLGNSKDIRIDMVEKFDAGFDEFWRRVQDKYPAIVIRDRAFLSWRFAPISGRRYFILVARLKGEMLGYAVIRCAKVRGIEMGLVLDLLLLDQPEGVNAGVRLVTEAEAFFRNQRMSLMASLMSPDTTEHKVLAWSGCRSLAPLTAARPFRFAFFAQKSHWKNFKFLSVRDWLVTLADFESL